MGGSTGPAIAGPLFRFLIIILLFNCLYTKGYGWSTMGQEWLNILLILYIHREGKSNHEGLYLDKRGKENSIWQF